MDLLFPPYSWDSKMNTFSDVVKGDSHKKDVMEEKRKKRAQAQMFTDLNADGKSAEYHGSLPGSTTPEVASGSGLNADYCEARKGSMKVSDPELPSLSDRGREIGSLKAKEDALKRGQHLRVALKCIDLISDRSSEADSDGSCMSLDAYDSATKEGSRARKLWADGGRKRPQPEEDDDLNMSDEELRPAPKVRATPTTSTKRGRGRPSSTGQYVGLAKTREDYLKAQEEVLELRAQLEVAELAQRVLPQRTCRPTSAEMSEDDYSQVTKSPKEVAQKVQECMAVILEATRKTSKMKGTCKGAINNAAASISDLLGELNEYSASAETARLAAENRNLKREISCLRREMEALKSVIHGPRTASSPTVGLFEELPPVLPASHRPSSEPAFQAEELTSSILRQVGEMVSARLAGLEERLLPEKRIRPPLAADKRAAPAASVKATPLKANQQKPAEKAPKATKNKEKGKKASSSSAPVPPAPRNGDGEWQVVERRKKGKKKGSQQSPSNNSVSARPSKTKPSKPRKLKPPRSAAVVVTLQPEAVEKGVTYADALSKAKAEISLADLNLPPLRFRRAATGARILEVPGATSDEKADQLAAKLTEVLGEDAKVSRPCKMADLRVSGLDDSVTPEEVAKVVAEKGGCPVEKIRTGQISRAASGLGSLWFQCPVIAARKLIEGGRLLIGWVSVQVRLLNARPLRCFRCLEVGHVGRQCTAADRSTLCFNCGREGHKAAECSAAANCMVCAAAKKPANHRLGSSGCKPGIAGKKGRGAGAASGEPPRNEPPRPTPSRAERMDTAGS